jgi:glucan-binding YG repeat protein
VESVATPGVWYYVDESGAMLTNVTRAILVNGVPVNYQFDADGVATAIN